MIQLLHRCIRISRNVVTSQWVRHGNSGKVHIRHKEVPKNSRTAQLIRNVPHHITYIQETARAGTAAQTGENVDIHSWIHQSSLRLVDFLFHAAHKCGRLVHHQESSNLADTERTSICKDGHVYILPANP